MLELVHSPLIFSTSNPPGLKIGPPLRDAPATVAVAKQSEPLPELSPEAESNIRAWLAHIEETDPAIIAGVVDKFRTNLEAHRYFLKREVASAKVAKVGAFPPYL